MTTTPSKTADFTKSDRIDQTEAETIYGLDAWGRGHFAISERGTVVVRPEGDPARQVDLHELVKGLDERGICSPLIVRFPDMLRHTMRHLHDAFKGAIEELGYTGGYRCVYPIKVNQNRPLCEEVRDFGAEFGFGLEAGSKPELLAVLGLTCDRPDTPIVCNGFKDREFIEAVLLATKLGRTITPVAERFRELELIVEQAEKYGVRPSIGIRIKPSSRGSGKWEESGGMRSKFGFRPDELLRAVEFLREHNMLDCLEMVHMHLGSQLGDIRQVKTGVSELAHAYVELVRLGGGLTTIDVGGGLGIDYDGSQSAWTSSRNYTVGEYAADIVYRIQSVCDEHEVPHPTIVSESGRALVASSSVLITDVVGATRFDDTLTIEQVNKELEGLDEVPRPIADLSGTLEQIEESSAFEAFHDALQAREEAVSLFELGYLSLPMRALADRLFWAIGRRVLDRAEREGELHEELSHLPELLADIYYCNLSVFQSAPDSWAIDQLFPICPIHRLLERPTRRATLADMTCDSDGKVDRFVCTDQRECDRTLPLHELIRQPDGSPVPYYLGLFLVGAYQEVLGDLHNLFGDTHAVHVTLDDDGDWEISELIEGDTVREVLGYVQFDTESLRKAMRRAVERANKQGRMSVSEGRSLLSFYEQGLEGYTYLE